MTRSSQVALTILLACLTVQLCVAQDPDPAAAAGQSSNQEVGPQHDIDHPQGPGEWMPMFLTVYLRKDGDWGKNDCITVFPEDADISLTKKPKKVRWVVLGKEESHVWDINPKKAFDDLVPPLQKQIGKGKASNAFWSGKPTKQGDWDYKIKVTEVDAEGNPTGKNCELDPKIKVSG